MTASDWVTVATFKSIPAASIAAGRLERHGIPSKVMGSGFRDDLNRHLWVAPEHAGEATRILATDEVPEDELTKEAMSFQPPDDA